MLIYKFLFINFMLRTLHYFPKLECKLNNILLLFSFSKHRETKEESLCYKDIDTDIDEIQVSFMESISLTRVVAGQHSLSTPILQNQHFHHDCMI